MAAFDRIDSGLPEMDKAFDHIRLGDNVVWQVEDLDHFKTFALPFARQAITDGRNLVYIRFASHGPLLSPQPGLKIYTLRLSHYFETFTVEIHNIIEREGPETFYIFDCLSELQVAWSTDLMMSNFFRLTCPFLFKLDTVAYFPILRGRHSFDAIARIRETTQILLDVYADDHTCYVHPLKVWQRYSPSMFLPHAYDAATNTFTALTDGIRISRFYTLLDHDSASTETQDLDSWDRFFTLAKLQYDNGLLNDAHQTTICRTMMTRDPQMQALILKNFTPKDFFSIRSRMIGTGMIGGKACGMLLARKLVEKHLPQWRTNLEPHDSFYIGSDVFYSYIVQNDCWNLRLRQRTPQEYFSIAEDLAHALRHGCFAEDIREKFRRMLEYFGQTPIIVRSSSILEDSFGNAFAGKYESVFCVNTGDLDTRLAAFEDAVRIVYASTMNPSALEYRKRRDLDGQDEQMALLVQRVSGSWLDKLFMPSAAGVGYSTSTYRFSPGMDISAGMLRLVMGLGTRAVDRTEGDYPRLLSLSDPLVRLGATSAERHRFSQHQVDVLDTASVSLKSLRLESLLPQLPEDLVKTLLERDTDAERMFRERGEYRKVYYISCQGLVKNTTFTEMMYTMLDTLEKEYDYPVDIEYTINVGKEGDFVINLLQCRPLQVCESGGVCHIPMLHPENTYFHIQGTSMGSTRTEDMDILVVVDPKAYYDYEYAKKPKVAHLIGEINTYYKNQGLQMMLIVPGRIGTSSPELGVPVVFADISEFSVICEVAYSAAGYQPELSYGSHMFQDLVESNMLYCALFENDHTEIFKPGLLSDEPNRLPTLFPESAPLASILSLYTLTGQSFRLYHNMEKDETLCGFEVE